MHDICVIGHITREVVRIGGQPDHHMLGGAAHYAGLALASLGIDTAVLTKTAGSDAASVLLPLREAGVTAYAREGGRTTYFENTYPVADDLDQRTQRVIAVADPFTAADLDGVAAKAIHLGPLTPSEMPVAFLAAVSRLGIRVSLDVQGFVRAIKDGKIVPGPWGDAREGLRHVDIVKADIAEAQVLTGRRDPDAAAHAIVAMGPSEVILTDGSAGSRILANGRFHRIPAYPPRPEIDPTGCGDTYMAGYLFSRGQSADVGKAGRFGAALASLKLQRHGPSLENEGDVRELLRALAD